MTISPPPRSSRTPSMPCLAFGACLALVVGGVASCRCGASSSEGGGAPDAAAPPAAEDQGEAAPPAP
ncbi:MAG: hypothetical protein JWP97_3899, partial [Labilithrix sp.]|nr:hypothetical protein [Labilithrix sp.]